MNWRFLPGNLSFPSSILLSSLLSRIAQPQKGKASDQKELEHLSSGCIAVPPLGGHGLVTLLQLAKAKGARVLPV